MRTILFLVMPVILLLTGCASQQTPAAKAAEAAEEQARYTSAVAALNNRKFVLEADQITFRNGGVAYVDANTNFVLMDVDKGVVQMAFNSPLAGPNGIGGITVEGSISGVETKTDKKGNVSYSFFVNGIGISAQIFINMYNGDNKCSATVSPNFNGRRITFTGSLYPQEESNVFKGRTL